MNPIIIVGAGLIALIAWLSRSGSAKNNKSSVAIDTPLPTDPLKKPIIVTSPPSPGVPKDVQKEVDRIKNKTTSGAKSPYKAPSSERTAIAKSRTSLASKPFGPPKPTVPSLATDEAVIVKKPENGTIVTYKVTPSDESTGQQKQAARAEVVKVDVVPMQGTPPIALLNHSMLPRPTGTAVKLTRVTTSPLAITYARSAFHAIVDFVEKEPNKPAEVAAFAAEKYHRAANLAQTPGSLSKVITLIKEGNALSDKAIKERKSA